MNYFHQVRAFYDHLPSLSLSAGQIALWHAMMNLCNRMGWPREFDANVKTLSALSALSESGVQKGLQALESKGLLQKKTNHGRVSRFSLMDLSFVPEKRTQKVEQPPFSDAVQKSERFLGKESGKRAQTPFEKTESRGEKTAFAREGSGESAAQACGQSGGQSEVIEREAFIKKDETKTNETRRDALERSEAAQDLPENGMPEVLCVLILKELSEQTGEQFALKEQEQALFDKRWQEGFRYEDFLLVIGDKCFEWLATDKTRRFLRPETLFGDMFSSYVKTARENNMD